VSRHHAKITVTGTRAVLADLDSKNGSYVRGVRVSAPTSLDSGDEVRIGPFTLTFRVSGAGASTESEMR
jgi:pSer/pThr/pTyr-binding forkhead associated (FHA) protein